MLKTVLTPKNLVFAVFAIVTIGIAAYLLILSTGFKLPIQETNKDEFVNNGKSKSELQYETLNPKGVTLYPIYGTIKEIDTKTSIIVVSNQLDGKEYKIKYQNQPITYKNNEEGGFKELKTGLKIGIFSKKEFDVNTQNEHFSHIVITEKSAVSGVDSDNGELPSIGENE